MRKILLTKIALCIVILCLAGGVLKHNSISLIGLESQESQVEELKIQDNHWHNLVVDAGCLVKEKGFFVTFCGHYKESVDSPGLFFMKHREQTARCSIDNRTYVRYNNHIATLVRVVNVGGV